MVTHTRNTHREHTPGAVGSPGSSCGFGALLKGTSVVVLRVERALTLQFLPARDSNSQPLDYESDSLTISPRLRFPKIHKKTRILTTSVGEAGSRMIRANINRHI